MIEVPKWLRVGSTCVIAVYTLAFAVVVLELGRMTAADGLGLALFVLAFLVGVNPSAARIAPWRTVVIGGVAMVLPFLGSAGLNPVVDSYSTGAWYIGAIAALVVELMWGRRMAVAWMPVGVLVVQTAAWGGLDALDGFGVVGFVLLLAVVTAGAWAVDRTGRDLARYSSAERRTIELQTAQEAYHTERQVRLMTTAELASPLLARIADPEPLTAADRFECRVLGQSIRDEIRGRRLLNDAMREQVITHRRRGAFVQVHDDGGLDDLPDDVVDAMLTDIAAQLAPLSSTSIVMRTAPADSPHAVTVVATSADAVSAALGLDGDETIDLWLEIPRPTVAAG